MHGCHHAPASLSRCLRPLTILLALSFRRHLYHALRNYSSIICLTASPHGALVVPALPLSRGALTSGQPTTTATPSLPLGPPTTDPPSHRHLTPNPKGGQSRMNGTLLHVAAHIRHLIEDFALGPARILLALTATEKDNVELDSSNPFIWRNRPNPHLKSTFLLKMNIIS